VPVTMANFEKRKDKYYFQKLAKNRSYKEFLIANFVRDSSFWIGAISDENSIMTFEKWQKRIQALSYNFKNELSQLNDDFNSNFLIKDNTHPHVVRLFLRRKISLETLIILIKLTGCLKYFNTRLDDIIWKELSFKIKKYDPFLISYYNKQKLKEIATLHFTINN
jgi:hypothetical protein